MYKIKQFPEDFIVKEIINVKTGGNGPYSYFILKKKNYNTVEAIEKIADRLNIQAKFIGFAGNKDKKAVTEQLISIKTNKKINLSLKDINLEYVGKGNEPVSLGSHEGNQFIITVRNLTGKEVNKLKKTNRNHILIPNYFGEQRFSRHNIEIGKSIAKRDFKKAAGLAGLEIKNNDPIGELRKINKKTLRLYMHAYQSYLFNKTIGQYLKINKNKPVKNIKIPVIGFGTEIEDSDLKDILNQIIKKEKISLRDFIIREMPELSSEGAERYLFAEVKNFEMSEIQRISEHAQKPKVFDIRKLDKDKVVISFYLPKGCYATVVIKELFSRQ